MACKGCGVEEYGPSTSGPDYCGACACGVPPGESRAKRDLEKLRREHLDALLVIARLLYPQQPMFNFVQIARRADELVERYKMNSRPPQRALADSSAVK